MPPQTLVLIAPAEPMSRRISPQPPIPGVVIQDAADGVEAGTLTVFSSNGDSTVVSVADLGSGAGVSPMLIACDPECGGGNTTFPADTVYVRAFQIYWTWDAEWGGHEVEFWGYINYADGRSVFAKYRRDGIEACSRFGECIAWQSTEPGVPMFIVNSLLGVSDIPISVYEINWLNNDYHGSTVYTLQTIGTWRPLCTSTCPPEDADMWLKRTYHTN